MKNEKQVVHNAIEFSKGFLEAIRWCKEKFGLDIDDKIVETESLIEDYRFRLRSIELEEQSQERRKRRYANRKARSNR